MGSSNFKRQRHQTLPENSIDSSGKLHLAPRGRNSQATEIIDQQWQYTTTDAQCV
jgi:hypothetical protein